MIVLDAVIFCFLWTLHSFWFAAYEASVKARLLKEDAQTTSRFFTSNTHNIHEAISKNTDRKNIQHATRKIVIDTYHAEDRSLKNCVMMIDLDPTAGQLFAVAAPSCFRDSTS